MINQLCIIMLAVFGSMAAHAQPTDSQVPYQARVVLVSRSETILSSQISAEIMETTVNDGDRFAAGQVLIKLDCRVYQAQLRRAQAELLAARRTSAANSMLKDMRAGSTLSAELSQSSVAKAEQDVVILQYSTDHCQITAPYSGRVISRKANHHQTLSVGQPILEILGDHDLEARLIVPSRWLSWLRVGERFKILIDETEKSYYATVTRLGARIDPASQTINVMGLIDDHPPELLSGMSGTATFTHR